MSWPKTYDTQCVFQKDQMPASATDILKDLKFKIERDGHPIDHSTEREIAFRYEPKAEGIGKFLRGGSVGFQIPVKCAIRWTENEKTVVFDFTANILWLFIIGNAAPLLIFTVFSYGLPVTGKDYWFVFGVAAIVLCIFNLIGFANVNSMLNDFTKYRIFWDYLNKENRKA